MISALKELLFLLCSMSHSIFWASDLRWSLKIPTSIASSFALVSSSTKWHHSTTSPRERSDFSNIFCSMLLAQLTHYPGKGSPFTIWSSETLLVSLPAKFSGFSFIHVSVMGWTRPSEGLPSSWWSQADGASSPLGSVNILSSWPPLPSQSCI